jgi:Skp family chaperone for outer membrane proteins
MKLPLKVISFFFLLFGFCSANESIRYVDINHIVNNSTSGKKLNQIIENKNKKIISELNNLGKKLEEKKNKIVNQKNILKKDELDKLVRNYELEVKKFDELRKKKRDKFNNFSINSKKKIIDLLNPLITNYLKKESIQILLQKDKIIFGDEKLDITNEILKIFNENHSKVNFE